MEELTTLDPELEMLRLNKSSGYNYRQRRQEDWLENYTLYRDKVTYNRLTQRQSVNLPLMKLACLTNLKDIDDIPMIYFENLDNDKQAEVFQNEAWRVVGEENDFELQDIVDKKQEWLYGRTFDQWQIVDGKIKMTVQDPEDILIDRFCDPYNIHSSRFLIHTHIFVPLASLANNPDYDQARVRELQVYYASEQGIVKATDNLKMLTEKNRKLEEMGVPDVSSPVLGETYVELSLHFVYREKEEGKEEQLWLYVECDDMQILMKKPLEEVIGETEDHFWRNHFPYNSWAGDLEKQDFWSDGRGDIVRTPNKVLNSWFSQLVENRTLRNFGMHYYDTTVEGFAPQTFSPIPWGWYGVPGKPEDVLKKVDIPDLSESLDEMSFLIEIVERATGATATQQGVQTERQITLGEVQLALSQAQEKSKSYSKFYNRVWQERGVMFTKLVEAAHDKIDAFKIYKKGRNTDEIFSREISPKDWMTKAGSRVRVWSQDEKNNQDVTALEKMNAVKVNMPDNPKVDEIYKRKLTEWAGFTPDEVNEVMDYEKQKRELLMTGQSPMGMGLPTPPVGQPAIGGQNVVG
jgi:hypothetical protein